jgi:hypothetical protein
MAEYERARVEEEGLRNFLAGADIKAPQTRAELTTRFGKTGLGYAKALSDQETAALEQKVKQLDYTTKVTDAAASIYGTVKDEASWQAARPKLAALGGDPKALPETYDPNFVNQEKMAATKVKDQLTLFAPNPMQVKKADGSIIFLDQNPNSPMFGKEVLPGQATGMTPFQEAELKARQDQLKVSQGQLAVAQQRLAAESATGVLSPESLDLAANLYAQTGTLPPLGIGKGAANLKSQIMNKAAQLSMSGGASAADAAANLVAAKQDVGSKTQAIKAFATGKQGQQVNAFNTAIDHLGTMDKLSDALANGDVKAINALGNEVAKQTGAPAPTNFNAAKQIVTAEIIKAVVASGGGVTERQEAERNFSNANSPAQLKGVIDTYKQLLGGQLNSLNLQYENTTGRKDFDKKLTPDAKAELNKLRGAETPAAQGTGGFKYLGKEG